MHGQLAHGEKASAAREGLRRYFTLLILARNEIRSLFSRAELGAVCDLCNGTLFQAMTDQMFDPKTLKLRSEVAAKMETERFHSGEVSGAVWVEKLQSLTPFQVSALCDSVQRYWRASSTGLAVDLGSILTDRKEMTTWQSERQGKRERRATQSTCDDQAQGDFTTLDTQRELNTQYVVEHGGILAKEYSDEGKTGTNLKRPGLESLARDAREGLFDVVVVTYMRRLARGEAYHVAEFLLKQEKVGIELVREKFTPDLAGHINKQMTVLMDGMYPKVVSQWTKKKQEQMVKHGYFTGGLVPFGYIAQPVTSPAFATRKDKAPPKQLVPHPDYAPFVRHAFEVFVETRSYNRVAEYLHAVAPVRNWTVNAVSHILRNDVYRGVLRYGENVNFAAYEPIVSEALWYATRETERLRLPREPKREMKDMFPYYLRGLVHCVHCGDRMTPTWHQGQNSVARYYECLSAMKKITSDCPSRRVNAVALHNAVLEEIVRAGKHPTRIQGYINEAVKRLPDTSASKTELTAVAKRLREVEKRIEAITSAMEQGAELRSLVQRLQMLEQERVTLEAEKNRLETVTVRQRRTDAKHVAELFSKFTELWEEMTDEEKEQVMQLLVERVDIHSKEEGTCKIRFSGQVPISSVVTAQTNRAGVRLELTTFGL